jgi:2-amino-4-hydroxy-6-hydroxymethyldihydropteridine diphosphokinase
MTRAFVSVGSNIEPAANVGAAIRLLAQADKVVAISTVCLTPPIGRPEQPPYYNCVVQIETRRAPADLKNGVLRGIEAQLGRRRTADKFAARPIDLDLIIYGDMTLASEDLTLPDPQILERPFLIAGLVELAPDLVLPGAQSPLATIAANLPHNNDGMQPLTEFTAKVRKLLPPGRI